jgi:hypothetical protein
VGCVVVKVARTLLPRFPGLRIVVAKDCISKVGAFQISERFECLFGVHGEGDDLDLVLQRVLPALNRQPKKTSYLGMNADRSKVIMLLPDKGLFVAIEHAPYRVVTGSLVGDCALLA